MPGAHHEEERLEKSKEAYLVRRLLTYLRPYKWHVFIASALTFVNAPLVLIAPPLTKAAVDIFIAPERNHRLSAYETVLKRSADYLGLGQNPYRGLVFIALIFLLANLLGFIVQYVHGMLMQRIGQSAMFDLRQEIFEHLHGVPMKFHDRNPVGRLMTRLTSDVDALNEMFAFGIVSVIRNFFAVIYITFWMFYVDWRLTLLTFVTLPLIAALTIWVRRGAREANTIIRAQIARVNAFLQEHISGMLIVQLFNREAKERSNFEDINEVHRRVGVKASLFFAVFRPAMEVIGVIGIALILWKGGLRVVSGAATLGTVIAFIQLARSFYEPVADMTEKYSVLQMAMAASERVFALLDEPVAILSPANPKPLRQARGKIEFRNVWFAYQDEDWVLKNISFIVDPGERVAFVGHTGAGKTTITNLLLRFYDIQRGHILFDDIDIRQLDPTELRSNFSIVLQDVFLYSGDIANNIRLGNRSIGDEKLVAAAREVHADGFIERLPDGYASYLHERGAGLSMGQKQLISFARALAFDPRVLILDEATSSIDTETEILIREAVERLMRGRTSLAIAHRLSTVQSVDKIILVHKGEIREVGTHQQLLGKRGLYWRLYQLQFGRQYDLHELSETQTLL